MNVLNDYIMGLALANDAAYETVGGRKTEWLLINNEGHDVFGHEGDTVIPGSGDRWHFLHRNAPNGPELSENVEERLQRITVASNLHRVPRNGGATQKGVST